MQKVHIVGLVNSETSFSGRIGYLELEGDRAISSHDQATVRQSKDSAVERFSKDCLAGELGREGHCDSHRLTGIEAQAGEVHTLLCRCEKISAAVIDGSVQRGGKNCRRRRW